MPDPHGLWTSLGHFLSRVPGLLPERPKAILMVSAHWETQGFAFTASQRPGMLYDYSGFPAYAYELRYQAPGDPQLARSATDLLRAATLTARLDPDRGFDHGVFIPLKVAFPEADIPVVVMSLDRSLDPRCTLLRDVPWRRCATKVSQLLASA